MLEKTAKIYRSKHNWYVNTGDKMESYEIINLNQRRQKKRGEKKETKISKSIKSNYMIDINQLYQ